MMEIKQIAVELRWKIKQIEDDLKKHKALFDALEEFEKSAQPIVQKPSVHVEALDQEGIKKLLKGKKRIITPSGRKAISKAQKARWAKWRQSH